MPLLLNASFFVIVVEAIGIDAFLGFVLVGNHCSVVALGDSVDAVVGYRGGEDSVGASIELHLCRNSLGVDVEVERSVYKMVFLTVLPNQ